MRRWVLAMLCALLLVGATASGALACGRGHLAPMHVTASGHDFIVLDPGTTTMNGTATTMARISSV